MRQNERKPMSAWQLFWRRRQYIVDLKLQSSLFVSWVVQSGIMILVIAAAIFGPILIQLENSEENSSEAVAAAELLIAMDARFWPAVALGFVLCGLLSVRFSHRIAGPLVAFKRAFRSVAAGVVPPSFKLREGDLLQEEARLLSGALEKFAEQRKELREARESIDKAIDALRDDGRAELIGLTRQLRDASKRIRSLAIMRGDEE